MRPQLAVGSNRPMTFLPRRVDVFASVREETIARAAPVWVTMIGEGRKPEKMTSVSVVSGAVERSRVELYYEVTGVGYGRFCL